MKKIITKLLDFIFLVKLYLKRDETRATLKKNPHFLKLIFIEYQLCKLYRDISGYALSKNERQRLTEDEDAFIYGEIEFLPFFALLKKAKLHQDEIFYDLGSGIGKAVFTAAWYFDCHKIYGIEILPGLHKIAESQLEKNPQLTNIQFINTNFLHYNFSDADIIFINATCLSYSTWENIVTKFNLLKSGSRVIVTTKRILLDSFELLYQNLIPMNGSISLVSIYLKK